MKVRYWGVRGSIPVPGAQTARYGGNSSCIEVRAEGAPPLVLDCGTGARDLGRELVLEHMTSAYVLFTHFHTDHLFGFPFFGPLYTPNCQVEVAVPAYSPVDARDKLGRYLNGTHHPVRIRVLPGHPSRPDV
jgi:phosphoribosyl 1,2-cyclic phosphodiesterase